MRVLCGYCKKKISKPAGLMNKYSNHFCCRECYWQYQKLYWEPKKVKKDMQFQTKIKKLATLRMERLALEQKKD
jgi:hypothetical protein